MNLTVNNYLIRDYVLILIVILFLSILHFHSLFAILPFLSKLKFFSDGPNETYVF